MQIQAGSHTSDRDLMKGVVEQTSKFFKLDSESDSTISSMTSRNLKLLLRDVIFIKDMANLQCFQDQPLILDTVWGSE